MSLRILYLGQRGRTNLESSFLRAFRSLGCTVDFLDVTGDLLPLGSDAALPRRAAKRLLRPALEAVYRALLPRLARGRRYDLVFCHKPQLVDAETIARVARETGARLHCFYPDRALDPDPSRSTVETRRLIPLVDCFFTFGRFMVDELVAAGARRVEVLHFAQDAALHAPPRLDAEARARLHSEVAFVGNYSPERAEWLRHLLDFDLALWGLRWDRAIALDARFRRAVRGLRREGSAFAEAYAAADIGLNLIQAYPDGHNMRSFEGPACGGLILSNRTRELVEIFREGEEIACFATPDELRAQVAFYLARPDERARVAANGLRRVAGETYAARARRILEVVREQSGSAVR
jgi:hypothetical protein